MAYTIDHAKTIREALEAALTRLAHRVECAQVRPSEDWPEHGSMDFSGCQCAIAKVERALTALAALQEERERLRKVVLEEAAAHCEETDLLMAISSPGETRQKYGQRVCLAMAAELRGLAAAGEPASVVEQSSETAIGDSGSAPLAPEASAEFMAEALAQMFHEAYERLAPEYGYATRTDSARPWAEVPEQNRRLMIATCADVLRKFTLKTSPHAAFESDATGTADDQIDPAVVDEIRRRIDASGLTKEVYVAAFNALTPEQISDLNRPMSETSDKEGQGHIRTDALEFGVRFEGAAHMPRCGGKCGDIECEEAAARYRAEQGSKEGRS